MVIEDLWYKNAIIYCLPVEKYMDSNDDGIGDFEGLSRRLPCLARLGVTCVWLQPIYVSSNRDNGYDVSDYYGVDSRYGSLGDFVAFTSHAKSLGIRILVDLVVNHTSVKHLWFQSARRSRKAPFHDWYVWSERRPKDYRDGMVFPGVQKTTWTDDRRVRRYYFHRFYTFEPDLNTHNKEVRDEIKKIMGFWLELGGSGFRMDAVPFLMERKGVGVEREQDFEFLHELRHFLQWRCGAAILLAEANVPSGESMKYFGEQGDNLQMMLNFPVNQRLFDALATGDIRPLCWALQHTAPRPYAAQWVQFLRTHDELDLGRLTDEQRQRVYEAFAPEPRMQLYDRGIRRRLAPMLGNDRPRLELAVSLLFSLPGTPMIQYGDEIGMGDDLSLPERACARTPMQWTSERQGGFSRARKLLLPVVDDAEYGYKRVNVAEQRRDSHSLLNVTERMIRTRRECPEISWGQFSIVTTNALEVLALRYDWRNTSLLTLHNFTGRRRKIRLQVETPNGKRLVDALDGCHSHAGASGSHEITLEGYGYRRGLVAQDERGQPRVYVICEPSTHYYQIMTRGSRWMPALIEDRR